MVTNEQMYQNLIEVADTFGDEFPSIIKEGLEWDLGNVGHDMNEESHKTWSSCISELSVRKQCKESSGQQIERHMLDGQEGMIIDNENTSAETITGDSKPKHIYTYKSIQ